MTKYARDSSVKDCDPLILNQHSSKYMGNILLTSHYPVLSPFMALTLQYTIAVYTLL